MTAQEIVQALRCCQFGEPCDRCPVVRDQNCVNVMHKCAADLIERLTAERDALLEQIKARRSCLDCKHFDYCEFDNATIIECMNCVTKNCPCAGCGNSSRWEWRGLPGAPEEGGKA